MQGMAGKAKGWRLPALGIERSVAEAVRKVFNDPSAIAVALEEAGVAASQIPALLDAARACSELLKSEAEDATLLTALIDRVELKEDGMRLWFRVAIPLTGGSSSNASGPIISRFVPMQMKRRGVEPRLVIEGHDRRVRPDPALLKAVARAHRWFHDLASGGRAPSLADIAVRAGVTGRYVRRLLRLAFLAPSIVETIMQGRQPAQRVLTRTVLLIGVARAEKRTSQNIVLLIFNNHRQPQRRAILFQPPTALTQLDAETH